MTNIKSFLLAMLGVLLFAQVSWARVCFLLGDDDSEFCLTSMSGEEHEECAGYNISCQHPKKLPSASCSALNGITLYRSEEDCCENPGYYEVCSNGAECENGQSCLADGYTGCKKGHCKCPTTYKTCDFSKGFTGVGTPCIDSDGAKYKECRRSSEYHACDGSATSRGQSYTDSSYSGDYADCSFV